MASVCFFFQWYAVFVAQENNLEKSRPIRIVGPVNFRQIERAGVWLESPGNKISAQLRKFCFIISVILPKPDRQVEPF